jgi:hypothetical protein
VNPEGLVLSKKGGAMAQRKRPRKQSAAAAERRRPRRGSVILGTRNVLLLVAGIVVILAGYLLLRTGSITAAPLLLVVGYCVMVPLSIVLWARKSGDKEGSEKGE